jgi:hypothetical protein
MILPSQLATLCGNLYDPVSADVFTKVLTINDVVIGFATIAGQDVAVLRGTDADHIEDWLRDFKAYPEFDKELGYCHSGFLEGMDDVFEAIRNSVTNPIITGHSLGGARARILAGKFAYHNIPYDHVCVFGSPKPAFINLSRILEKSGSPHISYRNRNDIVPTVPLTLPPFLDFVHTESWRMTNAAPAIDNLEPVRDHACELYIAGCKQLETTCT